MAHTLDDSAYRLYALSTVPVASHAYAARLVALHEHDHAFIPGWAWALVVLAYLCLLVAGVVVVVRATRRMSRPATIVVGLLGVWTIAGTIAVFLDLDRTGDWRGSALSSSFVVVYGVVGAGVVWAIDRAVNLLSRRTRRATA